MFASALCVAADSASAPSFERFRSALHVGVDGFSGDAAPVLHAALADADIVMLGEDHGIAEIPTFLAALCRTELIPRGVRHIGIEAGPVATSVVEAALASDDPVGAMRAFDANHPDAIAFFNIREEIEWLQACQRAAGAPLTLIGADQEFLGAGSLLLERARAVVASAADIATIETLQKEEALQRREALTSGDPSRYFLMRHDAAALGDARSALPSAAQRLLDASSVSQRIYALGSSNGRASNRERSTLLKRQFLAPYVAAGSPKALIRVGAYHVYRGTNPLENFDLGNAIHEMVDLAGRTSVHVVIIGLGGEQLGFAGAGTMAPKAFDLVKETPSFADLEPLLGVARTHADAWSLFDLRAMRDTPSLLAKRGAELRRLVQAVDFLVVIPRAHASHPLNERAAK